MKLAVLLLTLLLLTGCSQPPDVPATSEMPDSEIIQQEPPEVSEPEDPAPQTPAAMDLPGIYLYTNGSRSLIIDGQGQVLFETQTGEASLLYLNGSPVGFAVAMQDGMVVDEWGWASPARSWCDVYDLQGQYQYTVPLSYIIPMEDLMMGYNRETGTSQLYRRSDGSLLYDNVYVAEPVGDCYYVSLEAWDAPGFLMDGTGQRLFDLPEGYSYGGTLQEQYLIVCSGSLVGLLDSQGQFLLPCDYEEIRDGQLGCVFAKQDGMWYAIDPVQQTTVFQWPCLIQRLLPEGAIVQVEEDEPMYQLVSRDGTPLLEQVFTWPSDMDEDRDGIPELFTATTTDQSQVLCFRPDGTLLLERNADGYLVALDQDHALLYQSDYAANPENPTSSWTLIQLTSGEELSITTDPAIYCSQVYSTTGPLLGLFIKEGLNELGWYRTTLLDSSGNVLLEDLQGCLYRGDGVFQCRKGFTSGLMTKDGRWLYQESSFSAVEDD